MCVCMEVKCVLRFCRGLLFLCGKIWQTAPSKAFLLVSMCRIFLRCCILAWRKSTSSCSSETGSWDVPTEKNWQLQQEGFFLSHLLVKPPTANTLISSQLIFGQWFLSWRYQIHEIGVWIFYSQLKHSFLNTAVL